MSVEVGQIWRSYRDVDIRILCIDTSENIAWGKRVDQSKSHFSCKVEDIPKFYNLIKE